jgi:tRNA threonylcarbamoyladenosine biosynthesis protein TsaE
VSEEVFSTQIQTEDEMHQLGVRLGNRLRPGDLISLNGPLGAGKTTLTRGIGEGVGAEGNISSPTFLIARTHPTLSKVPFIHIDAYRLSHPGELDDLDLDFENSISVIEWGKGFAESLVDSMLNIEIQRDLNLEVRTLEASGTGRFQKPAEYFL